jgi:L-2-hydroxyglutarate oxidase
VGAEDIEPADAGVRAQAISDDGTLVDDFAFTETNRVVNVVNAPSPAATASIEIGRHIAGKVFQRMAEHFG